METLHPGLYSQETHDAPPIEGVSTSVGAFVGVAPKGQVGKAVYIVSLSQFLNEFGGFYENSPLAYAVKGFFDNGGKRCYVTRVVHHDGVGKTKMSAPAVLSLQSQGKKVVGKVVALTDGAYGNSLAIEIKKSDKDTKFNLIVYNGNTVVETFNDLVSDTAESIVNDSKYINLDITDFSEIPSDIAKTNLSGGEDGIANLADSDYIDALQSFDNVKVNLIAIPGVTTTAVLKGLSDYASKRGDCFAIFDSPKGLSPLDAQKFATTTLNLVSDTASLYYPWVVVADPIGYGKNPSKVVPPSGHIMGVYARMDTEFGCWRAPAGTDAKVQGIISLEREVSDDEQNLLNPIGVNCIRSFQGEGTLVWGARTLSKGDYLYIPVKRVAIYTKQSLINSLRWTVFRLNDKPLWDATRLTVENFLEGLWAQGALKGSTSKEAFRVVCDESINPKDTVNEGKMNVDYSISVLKPAEFVTIRLSFKK